jgi:hypothetical protein
MKERSILLFQGLESQNIECFPIVEGDAGGKSPLSYASNVVHTVFTDECLQTESWLYKH